MVAWVSEEAPNDTRHLSVTGLASSRAPSLVWQALKDTSGNVIADAVRGAEGVVGPIEKVDLDVAYLPLWARMSSVLGCSEPGALRGFCDADGDPSSIAGYGAQNADAVLLFAKSLEAVLADEGAGWVSTCSPGQAQQEMCASTLYRSLKDLPAYNGVAGALNLDEGGDRASDFVFQNLQVTGAPPRCTCSQLHSCGVLLSASTRAGLPHRRAPPRRAARPEARPPQPVRAPLVDARRVPHRRHVHRVEQHGEQRSSARGTAFAASALGAELHPH